MFFPQNPFQSANKKIEAPDLRAAVDVLFFEGGLDFGEATRLTWDLKPQLVDLSEIRSKSSPEIPSGKPVLLAKKVK